MQFFTTCVLAIVVVSASSACGQDGSAVLQGSVKGTGGQKVGGVTVELRSESMVEVRQTRTDVAGSYRFTSVSAGTYTVFAHLSGAGEITSARFVLGTGETKKLDLTLGAQAQFFDEPKFVVAGITDTASHGGHGSDVVLRSSEALTEATAGLRGEVKEGPDALEAARALQRAAEIDPSERNLFDWGTELLVHRASEQAIGVFTKGHQMYPASTRMVLGLAVALYARGKYEKAAERFFEACDLKPADPQPYLFLGKVRSPEITEMQGYGERMARFARVQPDSAWANYYYAASLWNRRKGPEDSETASEVRRLLEKAILIDPKLGSAYLQLGIADAEHKSWADAIMRFQAAIAVDPELEEAHYRLAQAYGQTGERDRERAELRIYEQLSKRERREVPQFVIELRKDQ